jgi:hypothetical protein
VAVGFDVEVEIAVFEGVKLGVPLMVKVGKKIAVLVKEAVIETVAVDVRL